MSNKEEGGTAHTEGKEYAKERKIIQVLEGRQTERGKWGKRN